MRTVIFAAIFTLVISFIMGTASVSALSTQNNYPNYFKNSDIKANPTKYLREAVKTQYSIPEARQLLRYLATYRGYETILRQSTIHNPLVFRQGGIPTPTLVPTATPIPGPPFDIQTPTGVIPGCLNLLCPPPQGALWVLGICWCTP
ncbi:MAG: hypothetical protein AAB885_02055 [Patescibacteria group bacterium]